MTDIIITATLIAVVAFSICRTVRHFTAKSGCCGSGDYRPKKKKLTNVIRTKTFIIEGMHCKNCKMRIEDSVGDINGVSADADHIKGTLTVSYAEDVDDSLIIERVERAGFAVIANK